MGNNIEWFIFKKTQLYKTSNEKISILHECRESKNLDRWLKTWIKMESMKMNLKNKNKKSENMVHEEMDELIKIKNNIT